MRMGETPRKFEGNATPSQSPPWKGGEGKTWFLRREFKIGAGVLVALGIAGLLIFSLLGIERGTPRGVAEETYTLVRDKISQSASIALALPKGTALSPAEAVEKVKFEPAIEGAWTAGGNAQELFFEPKKKLASGNYYTVSLETAEGILSKDFLVDEDPAILSIFPRAKTETPENSEITIVFNRPMVPLTTLDTLDTKNIPVEITPPTKGKWKWLSTRNLQFIPVTHLVRSSTYTVKVLDGLMSVDGLPVKGATHTFTTRQLRFDGDFAEKTIVSPDPQTITEGGVRIPANASVNYPRILSSQPVLIRFNQPVDLERTKAGIKVKSGEANTPNVPVTVEYGTRTLYEDGQEKEYTDKSVLAVFGTADRFGRKKLWDFQTSYILSIDKAFPLEGNLELTESRLATFFVPEVIENITATSPRSQNVSQDIFDPMGKLFVHFYEEVDKGSTSIDAPHLKSVEYGERCKRDEFGNDIYVKGECEKEADKNVLVLTFASDAFVNGEEIPLTFEKIFNAQGISLIQNAIRKTVTTFPKLAILRTSPDSGTKSAGLTEMRICSNTPLPMPDEKEFYTKVKSNISFGKWNWNGPYRITQPYPGSPCKTGEFESTLRYGLIPEADYKLNLALQDDFGQSITKELAFSSGPIDQMYRRFTALQKAYNVTSPERTKLVYGVENLEYVNLHICKASAETMIRYLDYDSAPGPTLPGEGLSCVQTWTKRIELPKKYWTVNFFEVNLSDYIPNPLGHYILTFSHPQYRRNIYDYRKGVGESNVLAYERSFLTVTNLAVQEKKLESDEYVQDEYAPLTAKVQLQSKGNLYWVTHFGTLAPVAGARVDLYRKGGGWASGGTTDVEGIARTPVAMRATSAIVTSGADSAIVSSQTDKFQWALSLASAQRTYVYTDRPIYRPSEDVFIKGLYRIGYDGEYEILRDRKAPIVIYDSRGEKVSEIEVDISETGTFTSKFTLAKSAPLGMYHIETLGGFANFEVEEYVPSAFKVELKTPKEEYIAGDKLELSVDANYYFGVPLEKGDSVEYSILTQDYYFDRYSDGWFQFGKGWYYGRYGGYGDRFLLRGKTTVNEKGKAVIEQPLDFEKFFKETAQSEGSADRSKIFSVNVTVKNKQGQTVSAQKSLIVHRGAFYLGANLENRYFGKGEENKILLKSVDTQGKPVGVGGIEVIVYKITWDSFKRQEVDGRFYYRSEEKREAVKTFKMRTNSSGDDETAFTVDTAGQYELEVGATDAGDNKVMSVLDFYVYGDGVVSFKPTNNETLELAVDRSTLKVGETANVIIKSPFEQGKALLTIERGRIFEYRIIDVTQSLVHIPVKMESIYAPNVYLSVILLSPRPEVKYGQVQFSIDTAEKELTIGVSSDKKNYLPGEKVTLSIDTQDANGRPVLAEISVAVADMSVLALKGNPKKNPVTFFYAGFPLGVSTASNIKNILYETEVPKGTKGGGGGDDLAKKKRGDFRSTALWQGVLQTDAKGKASITFTLPDNLTTWQSEVVGITKDTKVGVGYSELVARKEVMLTPLKPRFIVSGDTFKLGAKVFNQSPETVRFNIKAESATLEFAGAKNASEKIGAGESVAVYFDAKAPEGLEIGSHTFTLSAEGGDLLDSVEDRIVIKKNDTYESVATAFSTSKDRAREYVFLPENVVPDKGALTLTANSTLSMYITDALNYLVSFPYGCSEQIASKLSTIAMIKRAHIAKGTLDAFSKVTVEFDRQTYTPDELMGIGLSRIYANQGSDGGFTYYPGMRTNFYLSVHVLSTLEDAREAGYAVKPEALRSAFQYVGNAILSEELLRKDPDTIIIAGYALERASAHLGLANPLHDKLVQIAGTRKFVRETGSNLSLGTLALILSGNTYPASLRDEVLTTLENRLTIDSRGAFLKLGDRRVVYDYYETPIKDTALLLRAWVSAKKDHELTDKVLRWLLKSRSKDGSWGSTNNTLSAVVAFTEYMNWKKEADSNFELSVLVDGAQKSSFTFSKASPDKTEKLVIPVADISKGSMHLIDFIKKNLNSLPNTFYYDMSLTYFLPIGSVPARDEGFVVERNLYKVDDVKRLQPVMEAKAGEVLRGVVRITVPKERRFVGIEDFIPAGTELVNFNLATEDQSLQDSSENGSYGQGVGYAGRKGLASVLGIGGPAELPDEVYSGKALLRERLYPDATEMHDDRLFLFKETLPAGVYDYEYYVRVLVPGVFQHLPVVVSELYFPENFGRTRGEYFTVTQ